MKGGWHSKNSIGEFANSKDGGKNNFWCKVETF